MYRVNNIYWKELDDTQKLLEVAKRVFGWQEFIMPDGWRAFLPPGADPASDSFLILKELPPYLTDYHYMAEAVKETHKEMHADQHPVDGSWVVWYNGWTGYAPSFCEAAAIAMLREVGNNVITD